MLSLTTHFGSMLFCSPAHETKHWLSVFWRDIELSRVCGQRQTLPNGRTWRPFSADRCLKNARVIFICVCSNKSRSKGLKFDCDGVSQKICFLIWLLIFLQCLGGYHNNLSGKRTIFNAFNEANEAPKWNEKPSWALHLKTQMKRPTAFCTLCLTLLFRIRRHCGMWSICMLWILFPNVYWSNSL